MKTLFILTGTVLLLTSCGGESKERIIAVQHHNETQPTVQVAANQTLKVEVSGMSCVHACGGAIRMNLKDTKAVDRVSFDFKDGRKTNTCIVTFDDSKISAKEIIALIEKINDKQFTTGKNSVSPIVAKS